MKSANSIFEVNITKDDDIAYVRQLVRELSILGGLSAQSQTRYITAVSEIARNALQYAGGGIVRFALITEDGVNYKLQASIEDKGPGIEETLVDDSPPIKGKGITVAKNLVHYFKIESTNSGTKVILEKKLTIRHHIIRRRYCQ